METLANRTANNITDAASVTEMLPDVELARQVLNSSIISPQDMVSTDINFVVDNDKLPAEIVACKEVLDIFFSEEYSVEELLPKAIDEALWVSGAHVLAVIPETGLDSIINHGGKITLENISPYYSIENTAPTSYGILGPSNDELLKADKKGSALSIEQLIVGETVDQAGTNYKVNGWDLVRVTDNPDVLKIPGLTARLTSERVRARYAMAKHREHYTIEAEDNRPVVKVVNGSTVLSDDERAKLEAGLMRNRTGNLGGGVAIQLAPVTSYSRRPVGHPLVMHLPTESTIPVHVPGSPEKHVGYFILLDEFGNPLNRAKGSDYYRQLENRLRSNNSTTASGALIQTGYRQLYGNQDLETQRDLQAFQQSYSTIVVDDLLSRCANGLIKGGLELSQQEEFYRIMLSRQLANMGTQILFVPVEQITYFSYDCDLDGIGRSLIDSTKILSTMRSVLTFANTMIATRKATPGVQLNIECDPDDQNPEIQVQQVLHEYARTKATAFPIATNAPHELVNYLQNANVSVNVSNNPNFPESKVTQEERAAVNVSIDTDYEESLRKKHWQGFGLSPELIDSTMNVEFAQSIISGNLLMAKRIAAYQKRSTLMMNDHLQKYVYNSGKLYNALIESVRDAVKKVGKESLESVKDYLELPENYTEAQLIVALTDALIDSYSIQLPEPDISKLESQVKAFQDYADGLEVALKAYVTPEMVSSVLEDNSAGAIDSLTNCIKAYFLRDWLKRHNVFTELENLLGFGEKDSVANEIVESVQKHTEGVQAVLFEFAKTLRKIGRKNDDTIEKEKEKEGYGENNTDTSTGNGDDWGSGSNDDDNFGVDDQDDNGDEEIPAVEEEPVDEEAEPEQEEEKPAEEEAPAVEESEPEKKEGGDEKYDEDTK